jgi:hypothetical protein
MDREPPPKQYRGKRARSKLAPTLAAAGARQTLMHGSPSPDVAAELSAKRQKMAVRAGADLGGDDAMLEAEDVRTSHYEDKELAHVPGKASCLLSQGQVDIDEDNQGDTQSIQVKLAKVQDSPIREAARKTGAAQQNMSNDQSSQKSDKGLTSSSTFQKVKLENRSSEDLDNEDRENIGEFDEHASLQPNDHNNAAATTFREKKGVKKAKTPQELEAVVQERNRLDDDHHPSEYVDPWVNTNHPVKRRTVVVNMDNDIPPGKTRAPVNQVCHQRQEERMLEEAKEKGSGVIIWEGGEWPPDAKPFPECVDYVQYD